MTYIIPEFQAVSLTQEMQGPHLQKGEYMCIVYFTVSVYLIVYLYEVYA